MRRPTLRPNPFAVLEGLLLIIVFLLCLLGLAVTPAPLSAEDTPFSSMAVDSDTLETCAVPKPISEIAETAYLRNGYRAIRRILIARAGIKDQTCECLLEDITWDKALAALPAFQTDPNPRLPFKVLDLYTQADALEAEHAEMCAN